MAPTAEQIAAREAVMALRRCIWRLRLGPHTMRRMWRASGPPTMAWFSKCQPDFTFQEKFDQFDMSGVWGLRP